uniref:Uncharacterized protein n=1 Tax=Arundo donax TaxID=35708 RepID=A0A0A9G820_ARUDO
MSQSIVPFLVQQKGLNNSPRLVNTRATIGMPESNSLSQHKFQVPSACLVHDEAL